MRGVRSRTLATSFIESPLGEQLQHFPLPRRQGLRGFCSVGFINDADEAVGHQRRDVGASQHYFANGRRQFGRRRALEQIARRSGPECFGDEVGILVHGQKHQLDVPQLLSDLAARFETVQSGIEMSSTIRSGLSRSASATSARPSDAQPTISQSSANSLAKAPSKST